MWKCMLEKNATNVTNANLRLFGQRIDGTSKTHFWAKTLIWALLYPFFAKISSAFPLRGEGGDGRGYPFSGNPTCKTVFLVRKRPRPSVNAPALQSKAIKSTLMHHKSNQTTLLQQLCNDDYCSPNAIKSNQPIFSSSLCQVKAPGR